MKLNPFMIAVAALALLAFAGCASPVHQSGSVTLSKCPPNSHTVAHPENPDPRKAYGCGSDDVGFLQGGVDNHERMTPQ
jgi:hypothetical protein